MIRCALRRDRALEQYADTPESCNISLSFQLQISAISTQEDKTPLQGIDICIHRSK